MALNIKNEEAHALARTIAERTGLSLTGAVLQALREKNAALAQDHDTEARARSLLAYGSRLRALRSGTSDAGTSRMGASDTGASDTDELYDELGLPR